jgi:hypothetical protein
MMNLRSIWLTFLRWFLYIILVFILIECSCILSNLVANFVFILVDWTGVPREITIYLYALVDVITFIFLLGTGIYYTKNGFRWIKKITTIKPDTMRRPRTGGFLAGAE